MRMLTLTALIFLFFSTSIYAQIGLHLDNNGVGLHFLMHPEKELVFESGISLGISAGSGGLMRSQTTFTNGLRWNFYQSQNWNFYTGAKVTLQLDRYHYRDIPQDWADQHTVKINEASALNIGWTLPFGVSYLMGKNNQWEWHLESGVTGMLDNNFRPLSKIRPHLKVGTTYYFNR